jgi:hypothetical protein
MMTPTLLPSLAPEGELGLVRVRPSLPESLGGPAAGRVTLD